MAHDRGQESERIDVAQERELREWAKKFDASPQQIKEAVQAVGDRADKVEMHLKGSRTTINSERVSRQVDPEGNHSGGRGPEVPR